MAQPVAWLCLLRQRLKQHKHFVTLLGLIWIANYIRGVRRVRLHIGRGANSQQLQTVQARLANIIKRCPSLHAVYWPPWCAPDAFMQFVLIGLKELRSRLLQSSPYVREVLTLRDGATLALDWVRQDLVAPAKPAKGRTDSMPVCVLLHGAFMDSRSVTMTDLARHLARWGFPVVVMNRRGYGAMPISTQEPGLALFGLDEDLDEVLASVNSREPERPVAIVGFSCGSGFAGRYAGKRALLSAWTSAGVTNGALKLPRILCGVAYDPGYDVSPQGAISRMKPPVNWIVNFGIKYFYVFCHRKELKTKSMSFSNLVSELLSPKHGTSKTYRLTKRLSGEFGSSEWLQMQQPLLHEIEVPCLAINSRDDPVCVWENVEFHLNQIMANPNIVLAELARGSHGCKFGFFGGSNVVHPMIGEFVTSAWQEWVARQVGP